MRVLAVVDGSQLGDRGLDVALERAEEAGDDLTVAVQARSRADATTDEVRARVTDRLADSAVDADVRTVSGDPGPAIVELADGENFDRIVLGSGERSALGKISLGGVAEFVLLNAATDVTLVR